MNITTLKYLIYREFYIVKRNFLISIMAFWGIALLCILILLSTEIGNLSKLTTENMNTIKPWIQLYVTYFPISVASAIFGVVSEGTSKDISLIWQRFCSSTPVSKWHFSLAKHITIIIMFGISFLFSITYMGIVFLIKNEPILYRDISIAILTLLVFLLFEIITQVLIIFYRSINKALLTIMGIVYTSFFIINIKLEETTIISLKKIEGLCISIFPYTPIIMIIIMLFGFIATSLLFNRRES